MTDEPEIVKDFTIRRTTKLELGLVAALIVNVAAVVSFAITMATKVDTVIDNMNQLRADVRLLTNAEAERAVMKYRIDQLEKYISPRKP